MKNKKGNIRFIIIFMVILFVLLMVGFMMAIGSMVLNFVFDEAVPELSGLGTLGDANFTQISDLTITPVNSVVQNFTWMSGVFFVLGLVAILGFAFAFRFTGNKWLAGFYIVCMIMLVIVSIFMSNIYEEFYNSDGEVGTILHEHTMLSWFLLESPMVICILGFIGGVIMFTGDPQEGYA